MRAALNGLLESSLYVSDLAVSAHFYESVLGCRIIHEESDRMKALSIADKQVLLLFRKGGSINSTETPNGRIPPHDGAGHLHLAFAIADDQVSAWREHLAEQKVPIESEVHCGGHSIYLRDPDGHLVELISPGCWPTY